MAMSTTKPEKQNREGVSFTRNPNGSIRADFSAKHGGKSIVIDKNQVRTYARKGLELTEPKTVTKSSKAEAKRLFSGLTGFNFNL